MWETWVRSLGREDPLEEGMQPTPVLLPGESPWTEEPNGLQSMGLQTVKTWEWLSTAHMQIQEIGMRVAPLTLLQVILRSKMFLSHSLDFRVCWPRGFNIKTRNASIRGHNKDSIELGSGCHLATLSSSSLWINRKKKGVTMLAAVINPGDQGKYGPIAQWG